MSTLLDIFRKSIPPAVSTRVPVREGVQEKLKEVNQERDQIKSKSQSKPLTNAEHLRVPILETYPEEFQPMNPAKKLIIF